MTFKELTPEQIELINKPLAAAAIKSHPTKSGMSTIQVVYVTERLNKVFGIGAWQIKVETVEGVTPIKVEKKTSKRGREYLEYTAVLKTILTVPAYGVHYESIASSSNEDPGDAAKGAKTDAITEIAGKYIGIGAHVWRNEPGEGVREEATKKTTPAPKPKVNNSDSIVEVGELKLPQRKPCTGKDCIGTMEYVRWNRQDGEIGHAYKCTIASWDHKEYIKDSLGRSITG